MNDDETGVLSIKDEADYLGFILFPTLVMYDKRLVPAQRILYCILRRYARQEDHCFPGVKRLAKALGKSTRRVKVHLAALETNGLIKRHFREGRSTIYEFEFLDEVYCGSDRRLTDDVIKMLREVGEDHTADAVIARRAEKDIGDGIKQPEEVAEEVATETDEEPESVAMLPRHEAVMGKVKENQAKSDSYTQRRKENQIKLAKGPPREKAKVATQSDSDEPVLTVNDVEDAFRVAAQEKWPDVPSACAPWTAMHRGIVKNLCKRFGHELTIKAFTAVIQNWQEYVDRFDLNCYPNVKLVAGFADSWFPEIDAGAAIEASPNKRIRARNEREYDDATGTDGGVTFLRD